jgi:hypothetical protein
VLISVGLCVILNNVVWFGVEWSGDPFGGVKCDRSVSICRFSMQASWFVIYIS